MHMEMRLKKKSPQSRSGAAGGGGSVGGRQGGSVSAGSTRPCIRHAPGSHGTQQVHATPVTLTAVVAGEVGVQGGGIKRVIGAPDAWGQVVRGTGGDSGR